MIPFLVPELPAVDKITKYLDMSYSVRHFSNGGPNVALLEERLQEWLGTRTKPILVANATLGLEIAVRYFKPMTWNVPAFTFPATQAAVEHAESNSRIRDVDREGVLQADEGPSVPVCPFGIWPSLETIALMRVGDDGPSRPVIVDAAASLTGLDNVPSYLKFADFIVFSMHATKPFGVGEGGLVVARSADHEQYVREAINFGFDSSRQIQKSGKNAKMSEFSAAVGNAVLDEISTKIEKRIERLAWYTTQLPVFKIGNSYSMQVLPCLFPNVDQRDAARQALTNHHIETRLYYQPLNLFDVGNHAGPRPNAESLYDRLLCLPFGESVTEEEIDLVCSIASDCL
jgi:dTDP-4-amino-4,6-dideoxygalactose transaminase